MLYAVTMHVDLPADMDPEARADLVSRERDYARQLQRGGEWLHLWRVAGQYANLSIFEVPDHDRLHELLSGLPLFPYLRLQVTPLAHHPSAVREGAS